jgi:hypothetical protein
MDGFCFEMVGSDMTRNMENFEQLVQSLLDKPVSQETIHVLKERENNYYDDLSDFYHVLNLFTGIICDRSQPQIRSNCFPCRETARRKEVAKERLRERRHQEVRAAMQARIVQREEEQTANEAEELVFALERQAELIANYKSYCEMERIEQEEHPDIAEGENLTPYEEFFRKHPDIDPDKN